MQAAAKLTIRGVDVPNEVEHALKVDSNRMLEHEAARLTHRPHDARPDRLVMPLCKPTFSVRTMQAARSRNVVPVVDRVSVWLVETVLIEQGRQTIRHGITIAKDKVTRKITLKSRHESLAQDEVQLRTLGKRPQQHTLKPFKLLIGIHGTSERLKLADFFVFVNRSLPLRSLTLYTFFASLSGSSSFLPLEDSCNHT